MTSMIERGQRKTLNEEHLTNPKPGDYWREMLCPVARVLMVDAKSVLIQRLTGYGGKAISKTDPKPVLMSRRRFKKWLSYETIDGTWAQVNPEALKEKP